jgi:hypothetical protein
MPILFEMPRKVHLSYTDESKSRRKGQSATNPRNEILNATARVNLFDASEKGGSDTQSQSSYESAAPLIKRFVPFHKRLTKGTRGDSEAIKQAQLKAQQDELAKKQELQTVAYKISSVPKRQTFVINKSVENAVLSGMFEFVEKKNIERAGAFQGCAILIINGLKELGWKLRFPEFSTLSSLAAKLFRTGLETCQRLVQLATKSVGEKLLVATDMLFMKPGPEKGATIKNYSKQHCLCLAVLMNRNIVYNTDRTCSQLAVDLVQLPDLHESIPDLLEWIDSGVCFLKDDHKTQLRAVCCDSPGPIWVSDEDVRRMISYINQSNEFYDYFEFADRTKVRSTGASTTATSEEKEAAKVHFLSRLWSNNVFKPFENDDFVPSPAFTISTYLAFPAQMCKYRVSYSDESWVAVGMRNNKIWLSRNGEQPEVGNDKGIRFVLILFADRNGIDSWSPDEYGKKRDFCVRFKQDSGVQARNKKALDAAKGTFLPTEPLLSEDQKSFLEANPGFWFGRGGVYFWQIDPNAKNGKSSSDDESGSYKSNVASDNLLAIYKFQAHAAREPTIFVIDNAPYHKKTEGFSPHKIGITRREMVDFLKSVPSSSHLGEFWEANSKLNAKNERVSSLKRDQLVTELKRMMPETITDLERALAEIGMRKFGVPHRVLYLPARYPEWNPVEFIWAFEKHYFKSNREQRQSSSGAAAGTMGVEGCRTLIVDMITALSEDIIRNCFRHVDDLMEKFYSSLDRVREKVDGFQEDTYDWAVAHSCGCHTPTRSKHVPTKAPLIDPKRARRSNSDAGKKSHPVKLDLNLPPTPAGSRKKSG